MHLVKNIYDGARENCWTDFQISYHRQLKHTVIGIEKKYSLHIKEGCKWILNILGKWSKKSHSKERLFVIWFKLAICKHWLPLNMLLNWWKTIIRLNMMMTKTLSNMIAYITLTTILVFKFVLHCLQKRTSCFRIFWFRFSMKTQVLL